MAEGNEPAAPPVEATPPSGSPPAAPPAPPAPGGAPPAPEKPQRPDWLPEKFWDADKGEGRFEGLAKSYGELEKRNSGLRAAHLAEFEKERFGARPEKPEGYELKAPAEVPEGLVILEKYEPGMELEPGKTYFAPDPSDPMWGEVRALAHQAGLSNADFQAKVLPLVARVAGVRVPTEDERARANREFVASLGENGELRAEHLRGWLRGRLGEEKAEAIASSLSSRAAVEAFEELMVASGGARFSSSAAGAAAARKTEEELRAMMRDPRYQTDPAYQREVTAGFQRLYGGQDAGVPAPFARAS